ncbi:cytosolic endo-beta-N-acetylglucosaminidase 1-like, partial [Olea europaea subsp. europaea]
SSPNQWKNPIRPPFDPLAPTVPISYPLKTLVELESRAYFKSLHYPFNKSTEKLKGHLPKRQWILVCHDMAGGLIFLCIFSSILTAHNLVSFFFYTLYD